MTTTELNDLVEELQRQAEAGEYSGVILVQSDNRMVLERAYGLANRADGLAMSTNTRLATASGTKGFTALTIVSMIADGLVGFETPLVEVVGDELTCVDPAVTIEHLLGHTSGVGDYLDEEAQDDIDDHVFDIPVHQLLGPADYVPILNRYPQISPPGTRFTYNNGGYVMLALVIDRLSDRSYHEEVRRRVIAPAGMTNTEFLRSDQLPTGTARGYLADGRTNVFHLPVIGTGDGGAYTTGPDMMRFWSALLDGRIVDRALVSRMIEPVSGTGPQYYGLGFWVGPDRRTVQLEGMDAGVSMASGTNPETGFRYCLVANNSSDVWPLLKLIDQHLAPARRTHGDGS